MRWKSLRPAESGRSPQLLTIMSFAIAILAGSLVLTLPFCQSSGRAGNWLTSLFLATSATCVTGLSPVVIHEHFTLWGQLTLLALVQLGGLGIMTIGTVLIELMGRHLSVKDELVVGDSLGLGMSVKVRELLLRTLRFTLFWETAGALVLGLRFYLSYGYPARKAVYYGLFHSVTAFCNAGISLFSDSMFGFAGDSVVLFTVAFLVIAGGLGFLVNSNIRGYLCSRLGGSGDSCLLLHTKVALVGTALLLLLGTVSLLVFEWSSDFRELSRYDRVVGAFFQSAVSRTAGFSALDPGGLQGFSKAVIMLMMFVGGAPGSTAGGIKVTTMVILIATVNSLVRSREEVEFGMRTIPVRVVREAIVVTTLSATVVGAAALLLNFTERANALLVPEGGLSLSLLFETVSAFGTVGASLGATPHLSPAGLCCLIFCMFVGRLGPLAVVVSMRRAGAAPARRYPEENVVVG